MKQRFDTAPGQKLASSIEGTAGGRPTRRARQPVEACPALRQGGALAASW